MESFGKYLASYSILLYCLLLCKFEWLRSIIFSDAVCIFYLVLRALDTVEDDMSIPNDRKIPMLKAFHKTIYDPTWTFNESTEKDKIVLEQFPVVRFF